VSLFLIYPDPLLSRPAPQRPVDAKLVEVGNRLVAAAASVQAYGLAAVHLGELEPVMVVRSSTEQHAKLYSVFFNPVVTELSDQRVLGPEGSVSMPGVEVQIARLPIVEIAFDDAEGLHHSIQLQDFLARIAQHETDQVNGIFFLDRLSRLKRDAAIRKFNKRATQ
jgi:peptide deformylase